MTRDAEPLPYNFHCIEPSVMDVTKTPEELHRPGKFGIQ